MAETARRFRTAAGWKGLEARRAFLFLSATGLVGWVQMASGAVRFGPLALAITLVAADVIATVWSALQAEVSTVSAPVSVGGDIAFDLAIASPVPFAVATVDVYGSHDLDVPIGQLDDVVAAAGIIRARCSVGLADAVTSMTVVLRTQTLGMVSIERTHTVVMDPPASIFVGSPIGAQRVSSGEDRIREYRTGDSRHRIHWPVTARTGQLHVRAEDTRGFEQLTVVVEVGGIDDRSDTLQRAENEIGAALSGGRQVRLITHAVSAPDRASSAERLLRDPNRRRGAAALERTLTPVVQDALVHDRNEVVRRLASCRAGLVPRCSPDEVRIA